MFSLGFSTSLILACQVLSTLSEIDWQLHKPEICVDDDNFVLRPIPGTPRTVYVGLRIWDFYGIDEHQMDFGIQAGLYEIWEEPALKLDTVNISVSEYIPLHVQQCIWKPEIVFSNCKEAHLYNVNFPYLVYKVLPRGHVYRFGRYRLTVSCAMKFHLYPMDKQDCHLTIRTLSHSSDYVSLEWMENEGMPDLGLPYRKPITMLNARALQFHILPALPQRILQNGLTGNFTILTANFSFARRLTSTIVNKYIPSYMIVSVSWVSFWLDPDAVPGRVTLGVTSILTLATQIVYVRSELPPLDYLTAMDVWLFGCIVMVFLSLLEFTFANVYYRKYKSNTENHKSVRIFSKCQIRPSSCVTVYTFKEDREEQFPDTTRKRQETQTKKEEHVAEVLDLLLSIKETEQKILENLEPRHLSVDKNKRDDSLLDRRSRIAFPSCGFVFALIYWVYYLS